MNQSSHPSGASLIAMTDNPSYVIITPARNEAQFIELTLKSVVAQTILPLKWVIVSDGSTDGTDEIVGKYLTTYPWIDILRMPERKERHFAGKVHAFNAGYQRVKALDFDVVGNLDADVSFEPDHFEFLLARMAENDRLGLAGAPFREGDFQYDYRYTNIENVWGGCQLFRRECFEEIGGYVPLKGGGIDHLAVLSARMRGWQTRTFTQKVCQHHRVMGTALHGGLKARVRQGQKDYTMANRPLWQAFRVLYQMRHRPYVIGGLALAWGYGWSMFRRRDIPLEKELIKFVHKEQIQRLKQLIARQERSKKARVATSVSTHLSEK
jgi:poly-beta-1,6-N-acetyl-D-glucosamine synthase